MKVIVDNLAIEYTDQGKGTPVLLLHGWGDTEHTFDLLVSSLGNCGRFVRLDLPGFGSSEAPKVTWDVKSYVNFVNNFCAKIDFIPDVIVGHSFGGRIAIRGLGTKTLVAKKLVLIGSAGISKKNTLKNIFITMLSKIFGLFLHLPILSNYRDRIRQSFYKFIGSDYLDSGILKETYLNTIKEDLQQYASKLNLPTLLVWGENDMATPASDGKILSALIKDSKLVVLPGATHFVHQEQPVAVADLIKEFIC